MTRVVSSRVIAAVLVWALLFALLRSGLAWRIAVDNPNHRSLHSGAVPRVGGLAVVGVALIAMSIVAPSIQLITVVAAGLMLLFAVDDRRGLKVRTRLLAQLIAAAVASYTLLPAASWWFIASIVVAIMWSMNLYNFMDGADGLAGGMTLFGFGAFAIVAANGGAYELAAACGCIAGAAAGFLFHNFPPAKVFLGDAGSVPLGFLAAALGIAGCAATSLAGLVSVACLFAVYRRRDCHSGSAGLGRQQSLGSTPRTSLSAHGDARLGACAHCGCLVCADGAGRSVWNRRRKLA